MLTKFKTQPPQIRASSTFIFQDLLRSRPVNPGTPPWPNEPTQFTLPPLIIPLVPNPPPPGWTAYLHPEGTQYFFHEEKRVFTDANLFDSETLLFIDNNVRTVHVFLRAHAAQLEPGVDLVLDEYIYSDQSKGCQYCFVNHSRRVAAAQAVTPCHNSTLCVHASVKIHSTQEADTERPGSQLEPYHPSYLARNEAMVLTSLKNLWEHRGSRAMIEATTALHVTQEFELIDELRDIVLHALGGPYSHPRLWCILLIAALPDLVTSDTSTRLRQPIIQVAPENVGRSVDNKFSGASCLVGRLMQVFETLLIKLLSPLLFYAPDFHFVGLQTIYTDELIRHRGWAEFITRLNGEWQEFTLYATIVLNVDVAFLAIQGVDNNGAPSINHSPTQISSYLSILKSIGSIIIGLLLVKQNRNRDRVTAPDAATFISCRTHRTFNHIDATSTAFSIHL
ncbi:hypothetical protein B0H13DRAFT_1874435 [Mycena leptocephala]|nr:hypothetical protein B0H13DRAFT_1874435 [Mycena leptocephala]